MYHSLHVLFIVGKQPARRLWLPLQGMAIILHDLPRPPLATVPHDRGPSTGNEYPVFPTTGFIAPFTRGTAQSLATSFLHTNLVVLPGWTPPDSHTALKPAIADAHLGEPGLKAHVPASLVLTPRRFAIVLLVAACLTRRLCELLHRQHASLRIFLQRKHVKPSVNSI
jgi:hypothetical protein